jgi:hypothetical protein
MQSSELLNTKCNFAKQFAELQCTEYNLQIQLIAKSINNIKLKKLEETFQNVSRYEITDNVKAYNKLIHLPAT